MIAYTSIKMSIFYLTTLPSTICLFAHSILTFLVFFNVDEKWKFAHLKIIPPLKVSTLLKIDDTIKGAHSYLLSHIFWQAGKLMGL